MNPLVRQMFNDIAPTYDRLNHLLSLDIDKMWRRRVMEEIRDTRYEIREILDVATGTGDLAIAMARKIPDAKITGVDISDKMLEIAKTKNRNDRIEFRVGDAEKMEFGDGAFDAVTVAFGVRNFGNIEAGLREMRRVLRRGGRCVILEFSEPRGKFFGPAYRFYFHRVLPRMGRAVSKNAGAYTYLPASVGSFPAPERFCDMLREVGFSCVSAKKLTFGVAYIYIIEN